ncbi:C40 family peptidase [Kitasatospora sp. LaBMicrA B282]|uniref:C40 family peptidase n=1 Tax=Kitasatospora sp. LaBMicrA B282 TaxID=3420949 RepID=UPI003D0B1E94
MKIANGPGAIGFEEWIGQPPDPARCGCPSCAAARAAATAAARVDRERIPRFGLTVRGACLATTVLAGAGTLGLTVGAGPAAAADSAPTRPGWDGSRYWFKNAAGEWRYTSHYDVYLSRTGQSAAGQSTDDDPAMRQGWDGSRYWFKNAAGEWRYTTHYDVYLSRTGQSADDGSGMRQGWDGSRYWFRNAAGEWRYTTHYDVYLGNTGGTATTSDEASPAATGVEQAVDYALAQLGKPYLWGGDGPDGYDCSGLVQQAYRRAGIELPRVADDQYAATTPVAADQLRRGDLIFWSDSGRASGIHHVAIYLGDSRYVEAPRPGRSVRIATLSAGYYPTQLGRP